MLEGTLLDSSERLLGVVTPSTADLTPLIGEQLRDPARPSSFSVPPVSAPIPPCPGAGKEQC